MIPFGDDFSAESLWITKNKPGSTSAAVIQSDGKVWYQDASTFRATIGAQEALGYTPINKAGDTNVGSLSGASGKQLTWTRDVTPTTSANSNYIVAPLVIERESISGTTTAAGIGFHNRGANGVFLYYDPADSIFKYNRQLAGPLVTLWDSGNLTNLNQLTNGPGYITGNQTITLSGDVSGFGSTSISVTNTKINVTQNEDANGDYAVVWENGSRTLYKTTKLLINPYTGVLTANGFSGNASTATKLATARTLTIGSSGKSFDGSTNVSWTLAEIGAQAAGSYQLSRSVNIGIGNLGAGYIKFATITIPGGSLAPYNARWAFDGRELNGYLGRRLILTFSVRRESNNSFDARLYCTETGDTLSNTISVRTNDGITWDFYVDATSGGYCAYYTVTPEYNSMPGVSNTFVASASMPTYSTVIEASRYGYAHRLVNARTLTIGNTGKAFDGTANVAWSLAEIGAAASSHNHTLDSLSNVTITSNAAGEILKWNGAAWINNTLAEAGIQSSLGYTPVNKAGDTGIGNLLGLNGARTTWSKDILPTTSANTNYSSAPVVVQREATSGNTYAAGVGFHNQNVNAAFLYYSPESSYFKYNRNSGAIVTIWDSSNLTNLNQLTNGPGYITGNQTITLSGDVSGSGSTSISVTNTKINVTEHSSNNTEYPVVWDNASRTLYHTAAKLKFNPSSGLLSSTAFSSTLNSTTLASFIGNWAAPEYWGFAGSTDADSSIIRAVICSTLQGAISSAASLSVDQLYTSNDGNGTNIRIGNDLWIGDINIANTMSVRGASVPSVGYIRFGSDARGFGYNGSNLVYGNMILDGSVMTLNGASCSYRINDALGRVSTLIGDNQVNLRVNDSSSVGWFVRLSSSSKLGATLAIDCPDNTLYGGICDLLVTGKVTAQSMTLGASNVSVVALTSGTTTLPIPVVGKILFLYANQGPNGTLAITAPSGYDIHYRSSGTSTTVVAGGTSLAFNSSCGIAIGCPVYNSNPVWRLIW